MTGRESLGSIAEKLLAFAGECKLSHGLTHLKLTEADLSALEDEVGGRLPVDYREFLLVSNGGLLKFPMAVQSDCVDLQISDFVSLLSQRDDTWCEEYRITSQMRHRITELREVGLSTLIPVAEVSVAECVCVAIGPGYGKVFLASVRSKESDGWTGVQPLAESFTAFVELLVEQTPAFCEIEALAEEHDVAALDAYLALGNDINALGREGVSLVVRSIELNNADMLRACLVKQANASNALHFAVDCGSVKCVAELLSADVDVNEFDEEGKTPLDHLYGHGLSGEYGDRKKEVERLLLSAGAMHRPPPRLATT